MIEVCHSEEEIRRIIIEDPEMLNRSKCDGFNPDVKLLDKGIWLKWVDHEGGEAKALCAFKADSAYIVDIHIHIPKEFRGAGTLDKGRDFLRWVVNNNRGLFLKFTTRIPVIHRDVIWYAMKLGFKKEGLNRLSVVKGGVLMDMVMMGLTFGEVQ